MVSETFHESGIAVDAAVNTANIGVYNMARFGEVAFLKNTFDVNLFDFHEDIPKGIQFSARFFNLRPAFFNASSSMSLLPADKR